MTNRNIDIRRIRTDRIIAGSAGLIALLTYLVTLAPSVSFWDSGEYITASWIAGVPHPPGVPLFVLMGRFSTILFSFLPSIAMRVNLLCALSGAATVAILARLVQRWGRRMDFAPGWYRPMSVLSGLIATFSYSIWRNSNGAETYATALLLTFIILWAFDCWIEKYAERKHVKGVKDHGGWGEARYLLLISYLIILAVANHGSVPLVTGPPILLMYLIYAFKGKTDIWKRSWFILTILGLVILAFSIHLYMPIRAIQHPEINETDSQHWDDFEKAFTREQYGHTSIWDRKGPFLDQLKLYLKYLSWQSGRIEDGWERLVGSAAAPALAMIMRIILIFGAIYGLVVLGIKRPKLLLYIGFLFIMSSILFIFLVLNFKTGLEGTAAGEVMERDYFFGASFALFAVLSGIGLVSVFRDFLSDKAKLAWTTLAIPVVMLTVNFHRCDRSDSYFARDYGINLLESCPQNAVLITNGDNDTFPLWFAQGVLGVRRDVIVSNLSLMNTNWYVHQLLDRDSLLLDYDDYGLVDSLRPIYVWGPHNFHVNQYSGLPISSPLDDQIMRVTFTQSWPWGVTRGTLAAAIPMEGSTGQGALSMQDLVLINMIKNQPVHGREIYFAGTVADQSRRFLEPYQAMEGIAFKVTDTPGVDVVNSGRGWELMQSYRFTGVEDPGVYKCDQAVQLLKNYVSAYHRLAYHYLDMGEPDSVQMALDQAEQLFVTLPRQWAQVIPSRAMIIAKLIDGMQGPSAASDTLKALAEIALNYASESGDQQLAGMAMRLSSMATGSEGSLGYSQEVEYRQLFDGLDDGSQGFQWLRVELSLIFSDFISAHRIVDSLYGMDEDSTHQFSRLAETTLHKTLNNSPVGYRTNVLDTGLSMFFQSIDPNSMSSIALKDDVTAGTIMSGMLDLCAKGHRLSAISAGMVLGQYLDDSRQTAIVENLANWMLTSDPVQVAEWASWFVSEGKRVSPEELAWMAARGGMGMLMYAALESSQNVDPDVLDRALDDPGSYASGVPRPGRGSGTYSWVNGMGQS